MLKLKQNYKTKLKIFGTSAAICALGLPVLSFYTVPEQVKAAEGEEIKEWRTYNDITYMQEMTAEICNNSEGLPAKTLIDRRENSGYNNGGVENSYVVQKLENGDCWMGQNLKLDLGTTPGKFTSNDTDLEPGDMWPNVGALLRLNGAWVDSTTLPYYGKVEYQKPYGYYYNWCAATAETCVDSGEATSSVCPKGWKLPAKSDFEKLASYSASLESSYINPALGFEPNGTKGILVGGIFFPLAGRYVKGYGGAGAVDAFDSFGLYWSSTASTSDIAYNLTFSKDSDNVSTSSRNNRGTGFPIRCVANSDIHSTPLPTSDGTSLSVQVAPIISIDAVSGMTSTVTPSQITTGNITATVATNATFYQVLLHAEETALLPKDTAQNTHSIPTSTEIAPNKTGWGILNADGATYSAMATKPTQYYNESSTQESVMGTIHSFGVGVSVSSTLPADTYSTQVTVTAAAV